jgi:hypothetical protein
MPSISKEEFLCFLLECTRSYERLGCPALALQFLVKYDLDILPEFDLIDINSKAEATIGQSNAAVIDLGEIDSINKKSEIDWGVPETKESDGGIDWSEMKTKADTGGIDWGEMETKPEADGIDWGEMESKIEPVYEEVEPAIEAIVGKSVLQSNDFVAPLAPITEDELVRWKVKTQDIKIFKIFLIMRLLSVKLN